MAELSADTISAHLKRAADPANSTYLRGRAYEDVLVHIFQAVPGCDTQRNSLNRFASEEVDISVMNFRDYDGLRALPEIFLVECKNWSDPVDSATVSTFATKIRHRGCTLGVLVAANGVTGDPRANRRLPGGSKRVAREDQNSPADYQRPADIAIRQRHCRPTASAPA